MSCPTCEQYDTDISVGSPTQLSRIARKIQAAVTSGELRYNVFESDRELIGQSSFMEVNFYNMIPDIVHYHFECPKCDVHYALFCESYHGSGGTWSKLRE